jgi:small-conductance mechanosensitive channel
VTAQEFLGSCIFLFVKHPYDITDRVDISGPDGVNRLVVEQISLLYTRFKIITDLELIQVRVNENKGCDSWLTWYRFLTVFLTLCG